MQFPRHIPFVEHLGFELVSLRDGQAELRLQLQVHQMNSLHAAHGGVVMTLLDVAMAHAARSSVPGDAAPVDSAVDTITDSAADTAKDTAAYPAARDQGVVTIEMKTSFMRASHGALRAEGRLLHRTATMAFCEGSVFNADGALCAHATGTFKYVHGVAGKAARQSARQAEHDAALQAAAEEAQEVIQQAAVADQPSKDTTA